MREDWKDGGKGEGGLEKKEREGKLKDFEGMKTERKGNYRKGKGDKGMEGHGKEVDAKKSVREGKGRYE